MDVSRDPTLNPRLYFGQELSLDPSTRVWALPGSAQGLGYASDSFAQRELMPLLRSAHDLGSMSPELDRMGRSWPARYYLSSHRCNLLRPFSWNRDAAVLEVGSGCGTITRFLGETFREVLAVEGEQHRAEAGAARTRDQDNVAVVCGPHQALLTGSAFDVVFCVGVLEYSPLFSESPDPLQETLSTLRSRLRDGGVLVLAIENQLGLKYFTGAAEDHTGLAYDGLEGYRRSGGRGPRTVGRGRLQQLLRSAGFQTVDFYYPFPDYKFPQVIATHGALETGASQAPEFISKTLAGDYPPRRTPLLFDQRAAWHQLGKNQLIQELSNSFLVVASVDNQQVQVQADWDLVSYSMAPRRPEFWNQTRAWGLAGPEPTVERVALSPGQPSELLTMPRSYRVPWIDSPTIGQLALDSAMGHRATVADVARHLEPWVTYLRSHTDALERVPGEMIDAIPQNLIEVSDGIVAIDNEWQWTQPIQMPIVISRGLSMLYARLYETSGISPLKNTSIGRLIVRTARELGLDYGWGDVREFCEFEAKFRSEVEGAATSAARLLAVHAVPPPLRRAGLQASSLKMLPRRVSDELRRRTHPH